MEQQPAAPPQAGRKTFNHDFSTYYKQDGQWYEASQFFAGSGTEVSEEDLPEQVKLEYAEWMAQQPEEEEPGNDFIPPPMEVEVTTTMTKKKKSTNNKPGESSSNSAGQQQREREVTHQQKTTKQQKKKQKKQYKQYATMYSTAPSPGQRQQLPAEQQREVTHQKEKHKEGMTTTTMQQPAPSPGQQQKQQQLSTKASTLLTTTQQKEKAGQHLRERGKTTAARQLTSNNSTHQHRRHHAEGGGGMQRKRGGSIGLEGDDDDETATNIGARSIVITDSQQLIRPLRAQLKANNPEMAKELFQRLEIRRKIMNPKSADDDDDEVNVSKAKPFEPPDKRTWKSASFFTQRDEARHAQGKETAKFVAELEQLKHQKKVEERATDGQAVLAETEHFRPIRPDRVYDISQLEQFAAGHNLVVLNLDQFICATDRREVFYNADDQCVYCHAHLGTRTPRERHANHMDCPYIFCACANCYVVQRVAELRQRQQQQLVDGNGSGSDSGSA